MIDVEMRYFVVPFTCFVKAFVDTIHASSNECEVNVVQREPVRPLTLLTRAVFPRIVAFYILSFI